MNLKGFFRSFLHMSIKILLFTAANTALSMLYSLIVRRFNIVNISNALTVIGFIYIAVGGFPLLKEVFPGKKHFSFYYKAQHAYDDILEQKDHEEVTGTDDSNFKFAMKVISYGVATMLAAWAVLLLE